MRFVQRWVGTVTGQDHDYRRTSGCPGAGPRHARQVSPGTVGRATGRIAWKGWTGLSSRGAHPLRKMSPIGRWIPSAICDIVLCL